MNASQTSKYLLFSYYERRIITCLITRLNTFGYDYTCLEVPKDQRPRCNFRDSSRSHDICNHDNVNTTSNCVCFKS